MMRIEMQKITSYGESKNGDSDDDAATTSVYSKPTNINDSEVVRMSISFPLVRQLALERDITSKELVRKPQIR